MSEILILPCRSRVKFATGSEYAVEGGEGVPPSKIALLICDMWDDHWCPAAVARVNEMVPTLNKTVKAAREHGVQIIHSPSDTMTYYEKNPHRLRMLAIPHVEVPDPKDMPGDNVPLPIDDSDGGCDLLPGSITRKKNKRFWTRQHPGIEISGEDVISDSGDEIYSLLRLKGIKTLLFAGVHTNMCILNRSFGIKRMTRSGIFCILIRDLTDAMYNPEMRPFVDHFRGTEQVIEHIERYWCPTVESSCLTGAPPFVFRTWVAN